MKCINIYNPLIKNLKHKVLLIVLMLLGLNINTFSQDSKLENHKIHIYYTSLENGEANPLKEFKTQLFEDDIKWGKNIVVYPDITFQTLEGLGGAFNEIGGEALSFLDKEQKDELFKNLFDTDRGGFTFCRTAIGASDFGIDAYSYSEVPEDYEMKHFSIDRDKKYVLPYILGALKYNPDLTIFGSPWSPPAWMKKNGKMTGIDLMNSCLINSDQIYQAYARYFVKYIKSYEKEGVNINRICIQNETDISTNYPSNIMSPTELINFGVNYLKPAFKENNLTTGVYAGTFRAADQLDMHVYMGFEDAKELDGIGIQYMAGNLIQETQSKYPGFKMFHTESDCYNGENSSEQAKKRFTEVARYINSGLTTFTYWNMILNETTKSGWDWSQNSLININRKEKTITYNPDYNAMFIMSHFLKPGNVRIAAMHNNGVIAVKDKDGKVKILFQNDETTDQGYSICLEGNETKIKIPGNSLVAIVIEK